MLDRLPEELFRLVLDSLPNRNSLKQLCLVSREVRERTIPKLYESIEISPASEKHLEKIDIEPFFQDNTYEYDPLRHTKHVRISSFFHNNLHDRCIHMRDLEYQDGDDFDEDLRESATGALKFQILATNVMQLLDQLDYNTLKSFSWELGTCIPTQILGRRGCLPVMQPSLEDITLVTWERCEQKYNDDEDSSVDLSAFRSLRRITWIAFQSEYYTNTLRAALEANSKSLKHLRLEYASQNEREDGRDMDSDYGNFLARECLGLKRPSTKSEVNFPALSSLFLSFVSLKNAAEPLAHALNIPGLLHLTLRQCPGMEDFLRAITGSGQANKLLSLEYQATLDDEFDSIEAIRGFLSTSPRITDLFLSIPGPTATLEFWQALASSVATLTKFVYHQRTVNLDDESSDFEEEEDLSDLSLLPEDLDKLESAGERHPFAQLPLKCLGLGGDPFVINKILTSQSATETLMLLHIRRSGPDMDGKIDTRGKMFPNYGMDSDSSGGEDYDMNTDKNEGTDITGSDLSSVTDLDCYDDEVALETLNRLPGDLLPFALWAFGDNGIPSLQILAYGDFSFRGRFDWKNRILCRQPLKIPKEKTGATLNGGDESEIIPFRPIRNSDIRMKELVEENMDFLEACPVDPLFM